MAARTIIDLHFLTQIDSGATIKGQWVRIGQSIAVPLGAESVNVFPLMIGSGSSDFTSFIDNVYWRSFCCLHDSFLSKIGASGKAGAVQSVRVLARLSVVEGDPTQSRSPDAAGDSVLRAMGWALKSEIRKEDVAARYGGDEFAVLLDQADKPAALAFLDRIRTRIQTTALFANSAIPLTWSTGVSLFVASMPSPDVWMAQADATLHAVKQRERGGVVLVQNSEGNGARLDHP